MLQPGLPSVCASQRPHALAFYGGVSRLAGPSTRLPVAGQFADEQLSIDALSASYRWALPVAEFDVFVHSWAMQLAEEFATYWKPTASTFQNNSDVIGTIRARLQPAAHECARAGSFCIFNSASAAFSIAAVLRLVATHEDKCQQRYGRVLLMRPDLAFTRKLDTATLRGLPARGRHGAGSNSSVVWLGHSSDATVNNREFVDDVYLLESSEQARKLQGLFDWLDPLNASRVYRWGWWTAFIREQLGPVTFRYILPGRTIARNLCDSGSADLRPLRKMAVTRQGAQMANELQDHNVGPLASIERIHSWGYTCDYLRRFPHAFNQRSWCFTECFTA